MLLWVIFLHLGAFPSTALPPLLWHGHEMLLGFGSALISGFLLTAVGNWTNRATTTPVSLLVLVMLWLAARIGFLASAWIPYDVTAIVDCAYFPYLTILVARPILATRDYPHISIVALLLAFAVCNALFHLSFASHIALSPDHVLISVIDLFATMMLVVGGRIIPFFTERRLANVSIYRSRWLSICVDAGAALLFFLDLSYPESKVLGYGSILIGAAAIFRLIGWKSWKTLQEPMLWILHAGYLWLGISLLLRGVALTVDFMPEITALHAVTVGALGALAIGMMTRVALGHTGRHLVAGRAMTTAFVLVLLAGIARTTGVNALLPVAGSLWSVAFGIYFFWSLPVHFGPLRI